MSDASYILLGLFMIIPGYFLTKYILLSIISPKGERLKPFLKSIGLFFASLLLEVTLMLVLEECDGNTYHSGDTSRCTICRKDATHTYQGSGYCNKHYKDAVKWTIDKSAEDD